jgi:hypothetical protein
MALSSRCVKKSEATEAAQLRRQMGIAGQAPRTAAQDIATGSNRVVLGPRPQRVADGGGDEEEEIADVDKEEKGAAGYARNLTMAETETVTATRTVTDTETEIGTEAPAAAEYRDPAQLRKVIRVDDCRPGDGSRTQDGCSVPARATERKRRDWAQPSGIRNLKMKRVWTATQKGSGLVVDKRMDLSRGAQYMK